MLYRRSRTRLFSDFAPAQERYAPAQLFPDIACPSVKKFQFSDTSDEMGRIAHPFSDGKFDAFQIPVMVFFRSE